MTALRPEGSKDGGTEQDKVEKFISILNKGLVIPSGSVDAWPDSEWDRFSEQMERLTADEEDLVWDIIQSRQEEAHAAALTVVAVSDVPTDVPTDVPDEDRDVDTGDNATTGSVLDKSVMSMTDAEWEEFVKVMDDDPYYAAYTETTDKEDTKKAKTEERVYLKDPFEHCTCQGPGSKADKWGAHTGSCPCYQEEWDKIVPTYAGTTYKAKTCTHKRQPFELEEGLTVYASAFRDVAKESDVLIDVGVYLDSSWTRASSPIMTTPGLELPPSLALMREQPALLVSWPDMSTPSMEAADMIEVIDWVLATIMAGENVEVGCVGGHGRTGTMLASLLSVQGLNPVESVSRVWETYCINAVESVSQAAFIVDLYELMYGEQWLKTKSTAKQWAKMLKENFTKSYSYSDYWTNKDKEKGGTSSTAPFMGGGDWGLGYL